MNDQQRPFGRYCEELEVGTVHKHWTGRTVTEYNNTLFALLPMNQNPLFFDQEYARTQPLEHESASKPHRGVIGIETRAYNQDGERILVLRRHYLAPKGKRQ